VIQLRESALQVANRLGNTAVYFNDPSLINTALDKYNAVTAEQVKQAADKYLVPDTRAVVTTLPKSNPSEGAQPGGQQ
jgi:predicted Zn-dependent peptidase